ncbi:hypothetical protein HZB05_01855 [Candidatus Wolfebacteria bacterium]|nr:hypothetical protein [Candidatus Wolfebacteria bacterium]
MKTILIAYIPVIHSGYLELFKKRAFEVDQFVIFGDDLVSKYLPRKEIRALKAYKARQLILSLCFFKDVLILDTHNLDNVEFDGNRLIVVNDEVCRKFVEEKKLGEKAKELIFDTAFLRWDEKSVFSKTDVKFDIISTEGLDRWMMSLAKEESDLTSDWWRQVGCVLVKDGLIIHKTHNRHLPSEYTPYEVGDPRDFIKAGQNSELASAIHCEQAAIAWAASEGASLKGTSLYVTVFPCPVCAKLIAHSGISKVFYLTGHASLDGQDILKSKNVEIVLVK